MRVLKGREACSLGPRASVDNGGSARVVRVFFHTRERPQLPARPGIREGPRVVRLTS